MNYYQDITLLNDADIGLAFLRDKVYCRLHFALVQLKRPDGSVPVAVAFPLYSGSTPDLGNKIRLLSNERQNLESLGIAEVLSIYKDYVHITGIRTVPSGVRSQVVFSREQSKSGVERLVRRAVKRKAISYEEALSKYGKFKERLLKLPFLTVRSSTSDQTFKLFISMKEIDNGIEGSFNTYGLSLGGSVPQFQHLKQIPHDIPVKHS